MCQQFVYKGTKGNSNNFLTREMCQEQCHGKEGGGMSNLKNDDEISVGLLLNISIKFQVYYRKAVDFSNFNFTWNWTGAVVKFESFYV